MEIKLHIFVWIMPTAVPGHTYCVGLALPRGQSCPGGIFLVRPRAHSCCLSQPCHTCLQVLSLLVKLFALSVQTRFKKHIKTLSWKSLSLLRSPELNTCITSSSTSLKNHRYFPAYLNPAQTPFPASPAASLSKYCDLNCNKCSQPFHQERLNLLWAKHNKSWTFRFMAPRIWIDRTATQPFQHSIHFFNKVENVKYAGIQSHLIWILCKVHNKFMDGSNIWLLVISLCKKTQLGSLRPLFKHLWIK